eukprot:2323271-Pleurochrysis_carterae.AAC.1
MHLSLDLGNAPTHGAQVATVRVPVVGPSGRGKESNDLVGAIIKSAQLTNKYFSQNQLAHCPKPFTIRFCAPHSQGSSKRLN